MIVLFSINQGNNTNLGLAHLWSERFAMQAVGQQTWTA